LRAHQENISLKPKEGTPMIAVGDKAPGFNLPDHLGRAVTLDQFAGKRNVMLLYYPLDFTPT
jgi:peroxiredoxin